MIGSLDIAGAMGTFAVCPDEWRISSSEFNQAKLVPNGVGIVPLNVPKCVAFS